MTVNQRSDNAAGPPQGAGEPEMPLMLARQDQEVVLARVAGGRGIAHRLAEMGIAPGSRFRVLSSGRNGPFIVLIKDSRFVLGRGMVGRMFVRPV